MYRLKKLLFGWDYIQWRNSTDSGVARIIKLPDGRLVYWRHRVTSVMDEIKYAKEVFWLTCEPSKYGL